MCLQTSDHEIWCSRGSELTPSLTFQIKGQTSNKNMIHITHTHSNIPTQGAQHGSIYIWYFWSEGNMIHCTVDWSETFYWFCKISNVDDTYPHTDAMMTGDSCRDHGLCCKRRRRFLWLDKRLRSHWLWTWSSVAHPHWCSSRVHDSFSSDNLAYICSPCIGEHFHASGECWGICSSSL